MIWFGGSTTQGAWECIHPLPTLLIHTHTPACSLVECECKGCQKQRKRQPQINTFKWYGKKDGRKKWTRVLTTDLVTNSISVKARASEMSELCPMLNLFFCRYAKRWVLVLQNCLGWEGWYQSLAFGVFLFPFYEEGSTDFSSDHCCVLDGSHLGSSPSGLSSSFLLDLWLFYWESLGQSLSMAIWPSCLYL